MPSLKESLLLSNFDLYINDERKAVCMAPMQPSFEQHSCCCLPREMNKQLENGSRRNKKRQDFSPSQNPAGSVETFEFRKNLDE